MTVSAGNGMVDKSYFMDENGLTSDSQAGGFTIMVHNFVPGDSQTSAEDDHGSQGEADGDSSGGSSGGAGGK